MCVCVCVCVCVSFWTIKQILFPLDLKEKLKYPLRLYGKIYTKGRKEDRNFQQNSISGEQVCDVKVNVVLYMQQVYGLVVNVPSLLESTCRLEISLSNRANSLAHVLNIQVAFTLGVICQISRMESLIF